MRTSRPTRPGLLLALIGSLLAAPPADAAAAPTGTGVVADVPANKLWDVDATSATYTGGGRAPGTIQVVLNKAALAGQTLSVQADGDYLLVGDDAAGDVRASFAVPPKPATDTATDGVVSTLQLVAGDHPTVAFDGRDSARENGHWRRLAHSPSPTLTLSVSNATFAILTFAPAAPVALPAPVVVVPPVRVTPPPPPPAVAAHRVRPARLRAVAGAFADAVARPCPACSGTGHVTTQVQYGTQRQGGLLYPLMRDVQQRCDTCLGTGTLHARPEAVLHAAADLVHALIDLDRSDPDADDALKSTYEVMTLNAVGDRRCWDTLTRDARGTLSVAHPRPSSALVAEVIVDAATTDDAGRRRFRGHLAGTTDAVVVDDPPSADNVASGPVLVGGLIARVAGPDEPDAGATVIRGAFVISPVVDRHWTWWVTHDVRPAVEP